MSRMKYPVLFAALLFAAAAHPHEPLADPAAYLAARGVHGEIQSAWVERAQGEPPRYVYGFRTGAPGAPVDHYFDAATAEAIGPLGLAARGILPKPAEAPALSVAAERVDTGPALKAAARAKVAGALPEMVLPPVDRARLLAEDATRDAFERGALRLGVAEDLPEPLTGAAVLAQGKRAPGGAAALAIRAPGARGLRLHVTIDDPRAAAGLRVYDPARPAEIHSPPPGAAAWWTPTCWGEAVHVECDAPGFTIDRALQVYRVPGDAEEKAAGFCEIDAACHERWGETALGVGGIGTVNRDDFIFCTASLLVDAVPESDVPYLLTANHCVKNGTEANALEAYWLYQADTCNGAVPDIADAPRTLGGADYLAGSGNLFGTDLSLLRLREPPPAGLTWLGWETAAPALGAEAVCIHHPDGDYKRISFGEITDSGSGRLRPASRYHEVTWYAGVTEPGSSGSPLFLASTHRIIGQLYGGGSSCSQPLAPDYYGRFDVSYLAAQQFLGFVSNPYDVNGDREVNAADLQSIVNLALARPRDRTGDFDGDGRVSAVDVQALVFAVLSFSR